MHSLHTDHPIFASHSAIRASPTFTQSTISKEKRLWRGKVNIYIIRKKKHLEIFKSPIPVQKKKKRKSGRKVKGIGETRAGHDTHARESQKAPISREIIEVVRAAYLSSSTLCSRSSLPCHRSRSRPTPAFIPRLLSRRAAPALVSRPRILWNKCTDATYSGSGRKFN